MVWRNLVLLLKLLKPSFRRFIIDEMAKISWLNERECCSPPRTFVVLGRMLPSTAKVRLFLATKSNCLKVRPFHFP